MDGWLMVNYKQIAGQRYFLDFELAQDSPPRPKRKKLYKNTRSLGALRAPTSSWRPFGPLDFVLCALRALRPCDPRNSDLYIVIAVGQCVSRWIVCQPLDNVLAAGQCVSRWIVCQPGFFGYTGGVGITYSRSQDLMLSCQNQKSKAIPACL